MKFVALGSVAEVIAGQSPEGKFYNANGDGLPFYQGKKEFAEKFIGNPTVWTRQTTRLSKKGDILMSVRAPVGPVNFATQDVCIGRGLAAIRTSREINPDYLFYQLLHLQPEIAGNEGAVFASINKTQIEALPVVAPSLVEQHRIVALLDEAFAGIATAKANAEKSLESAYAVFQAALASRFGGANDWPERKLGELCEIARGGSPRPIKAFLTDAADGVNWIKISDASASSKYIYRTKEKIKPSGVSRSRLVHSGDFLLSNSMSFGRPYIMRTSGCIHDGWLVLSGYEGSFDQDFLFLLLGSQFMYQQFDRLAAGSTVRNLNIELASRVSVPVPPLATQKETAMELEALDGEVSNLQSLYTRKLAALGELEQSLLQQAFSGQM